MILRGIPECQFVFHRSQAEIITLDVFGCFKISQDISWCRKMTVELRVRVREVSLAFTERDCSHGRVETNCLPRDSIEVLLRLNLCFQVDKEDFTVTVTAVPVRIFS